MNNNSKPGTPRPNTAAHQKPPVLGDVAKAAGVSVPTVSRVLTSSKYVAPSLRTRVLKAVSDLGYRPNEAARATRSGKRSMVAVLTGATSNYGYAQTIEGIERAARKAGMSIIIAVVESGAEEAVNAAIDLVLSQPVAGVIVLEFDRPGLAAAKAFPQSIPMVVAGGGTGRSTGTISALLDEQAAGRDATDHLLSLGHRTVHHIAVPTMGKQSGRTEGWKAALAAAGVPIPKILHATWEPASGYRMGLKLASQSDVTAVFCGNDDVAIGVIKAFLECGRRVPEDVSVVGFDDQPHVAMWRPPLTTIRQDFQDLGARAFRLLERVLDGAKPQSPSTVKPQLIIRGSTAVVRSAAIDQRSTPV
ncbi:LacI family DNA-binding transcriptional regulator [Paenarthrobacter histidinolovorans]|uniref:LacI family DNA-binding transcriptional regulator n=1 Tax=Paenarthrobacter histidinolovorans TaxID=43664 RepID=UPI0016668045|nr:substrate-binding domain-containing protein [Paenarthrobacter histidinolovorans]GGJ22450.1 LacI family transcriptional regulator [Paenarthrobacter histidinolovorans]